MPDPTINSPAQRPNAYGQAPLDPGIAAPQPAPQPVKRSGKSGLLVGFVVLLILIAVGLFMYGHNRKSSTTSTTPVAAAVRTATVSVDSQGFTPVTLSIPVGTTVTWTTKDAGPHIIASDRYPKDDILPGLKSHQLSLNARYSYDFKKPGTYPYHDDLHPEINGAIVVK